MSRTTAEPFDELRTLLSALCDGNIRDDQVTRLEQRVCADPEARWYYIRYMHVHANLARFAQIEAEEEAGTGLSRLASLVTEGQAPMDAGPAIPVGSQAASAKGDQKPARTGWPFKRMTTLSAAAAIILLVSALAGWLLPGNSRSDQAFAAVLEQLRTARVITFTADCQLDGETVDTIDAMHLQPDRVRQNLADGGAKIIDFSKRRMITLDPVNRRAKIVEDASGPHKGYVLRNFLDEVKDNIERISANPRRTERYLGKKTIDGRVVKGYEMQKTTQTQTLWVDVETGMPVRIKVVDADDPGRNLVIRNFRFDVELDESLFSLTPPPGYEVTYEKVDL